MEQPPKEEDFNCSICLCLMVEPLSVPGCNHNFCLSCLIGLEDNAPKLKCPLCRKQLQINSIEDLKINSNLQQKIKLFFPKQFEQQMQNVIQERKQQENILKIKFEFGNDHSLVDNPQKSRDGNHVNKHKWCCFIRLKCNNDNISKYIQKVEFKLHETFSMPLRVVTKPPFQVSSGGWGYFEIPIKIYWQSWLKMDKPTVLNHELNFNEKGETKLFTLKKILEPGQQVPNKFQSLEEQKQRMNSNQNDVKTSQKKQIKK